MAEELQHLIERIQREAVDTGEQQATKIVSQAKEKAAGIVRDAEAEASRIIEQAEQDAKQYRQRGEQALAQSSRDLLITVGSGIEKIFTELVAGTVDGTLDEDEMKDLIGRVVEAYLREGGETSIELVLSDEDKSRLESFFRGKFASELEKGLTVAADARMTKGFKVRLRGKNVEHDFSREAIAEAVSAYLRPVLAETVYRVAREQQQSASE